MKSVLEGLAASLDRIRAELELHNVLSDALETRYRGDTRALQEYNRRARRSTYSNMIVGCYGLIEQTIDSVLVAVANAFGQFHSRYDEVPEGVRNEHRNLLLQCLREGDRARTRGKINERAALEALGRDVDQPATLLAMAFTLSTANYRLPYVGTLFARLGVDINAGLSRGEPTDALEKTGFANYESFLEDLVQRRNDLAHSYGDENIIDPGLLETYVDLVAAYLRAVDRVATRFIVTKMLQSKLPALGTVVRTWTGVVGVQVVNGRIAVGDCLLLVKDDWCTSHEVTSLQSDDQTMAEVAFAGTPVNVGAKVAEVPTSAENALAYVIPSAWMEFWPTHEK